MACSLAIVGCPPNIGKTTESVAASRYSITWAAGFGQKETFVGQRKPHTNGGSSINAMMCMMSPDKSLIIRNTAVLPAELSVKV